MHSSQNGSRVHPTLAIKRGTALRYELGKVRRGSRPGLRLFLGILFAALVPLAAQQTKMQVTVFDQKTGEPIKGLNASNFSVVDGKTQLRVEHVEYKERLLDAMVLVDTSLVGEMVGPLGAAFVNGLGEKDQMAIVSYHSSAELIQDFTSSKQLLQTALQSVRYGNSPRVLDALYAALDGGFQNTVGRRVILLLSAGVEGYSRISEAEVHRLARQRRVSIFPVYVIGAERGMFRRLAQRSGGAYFEARKLKLNPKALSDLVYSVVRGYYELDVTGVYTLGDRLEVKIRDLPKSKRKIWTSALPLE